MSADFAVGAVGSDRPNNVKKKYLEELKVGAANFMHGQAVQFNELSNRLSTGNVKRPDGASAASSL